jgi:hypothetical protein
MALVSLLVFKKKMRVTQKPDDSSEHHVREGSIGVSIYIIVYAGVNNGK